MVWTHVPDCFQNNNRFGYGRNDEVSVIRSATRRPSDPMRLTRSQDDIARASQAIVPLAILPTLNSKARQQGATIRLIVGANGFKAAKKYLVLDASKVVRCPPNQ